MSTERYSVCVGKVDDYCIILDQTWQPVLDLTQEMKTWLDERVPNRNWSWSICESKLGRDNVAYVWVNIADKNTATQFKLRWSQTGV